MATIAQRIKEALAIRGMKQTDLAEQTGIGKSSISTYISGSYIPKQKNFYKIAKALNVSEPWLRGFDVPMNKESFEQQWDKEAQQFSDKISAFYYQLKGLGWTYEWLDTEKLYLLSNGTTSTKITAEEYGKLVDESEDFCRKQLQKLLLKSSSLLNAAHARTDINIPEDTDTSDEDIMDDENF